MSERTTAEVAMMAGVSVATIRKWKKRGDLPSAPIGRPGMGRGNECMWDEAASQEVIARANERRSTGFRRPRP